MFECRHQPLPLPAPLVEELAAAYGEPHRAYHNATHVAEVLGWYDQVADEVGWDEPREVYAAIVFHDAIYQPGAKDNEWRSAQWAERAALPVDSKRVMELIMLTARHGAVDSADRDAALFLDCDMAILGAPPHQFTAYDEAIAKEFSHVPPDAFRAGRRAFLHHLANKPRIYLSDYFHDKLDAHARMNLAVALARY